MTHTYADLKEMYRLMLKAQTEKGFPLTLRELSGIWKVAIGPTHARLQHLYNEGFLDIHEAGRKTLYKAKDESLIRD